MYVNTIVKYWLVNAIYFVTVRSLLGWNASWVFLQFSDCSLFATASGYATLDWAYLAVKLTHTVFLSLTDRRVKFLGLLLTDHSRVK